MSENKEYSGNAEHKILLGQVVEDAEQDDEFLLKMAKEAEEKWDKALENDPALAERFHADRDRQLELLIRELKKRSVPGSESGITAAGVGDAQQPTGGRKEVKSVLGKRARIALIAAVIIVAAAGYTMARGSYRYQAYPDLPTGRMNVLRANHSFGTSVSVLDKAYQEIEEKLHIPLLYLEWMPKGMRYVSHTIANGGAVVEFEYNGYRLFLREVVAGGKYSTNIAENSSSRERSVYNTWMKEDLTITEHELERGETEYSVSIMRKDGYYAFSGIMKDYETFREIAENMIIH